MSEGQAQSGPSRIRKGMTITQVEELNEDQLYNDAQEYLATLINRDPYDIQAIIRLPHRPTNTLADKGKSKEMTNGAHDYEDEQAGTSEPLLDTNSWIYESLRRICRDLTSPWLLALQQVCNRSSCHEMKGGEWLYLCAAHASANETECCAIDYINHTLDAASALLCSKRYFPSRLGIPDTSIKHFTSISRRLYRIFGHAYYHHNDIFQACESETSLYSRFKLLMTEYELLSEDILVVPATFDVEPAIQEPQERVRQITQRPVAAPLGPYISEQSATSAAEE